MHNESVLIVNDQPSVSNADPVNSRKLIEATNLNKASKAKPTTDELNNSASRFVTGSFNRASSKCPKHLISCLFLRKENFVKKPMSVTSYIKNVNFVITCNDPSVI